MRLLNVRLGDEDARLVRRLRERGISISDVVRRAIRAEARSAQAANAPDIDQLLAHMSEAFPTPSGPARPRPKSTDRQGLRALVRAKLRRHR